MTEFAYRLHGYRLVTDVDLGEVAPRDHDLAAPVTGTVRVLRGDDRPIGWEPPPGELVGRLDDGTRTTFYTFARDAGRLRMRFHGAAEIDCDDRLEEGLAHVAPDFDPSIVGVLLPGTVTAARLVLDRRLVLHASALQVGTGAVAFVGSPGMGKSTLAGLGMAAGYRLLTDDVLRADLDGGDVRVWPGASEVRLRSTAFSMTDLVGAQARRSRRTADGRLAFAVAGGSAAGAGPDAGGRGVDASVHDDVPLLCCVVPYPRRDVDEVQVHRLGAFEAFRELTGFPRITGWCEPSTLARQFDLLGALCERVPVYAAVIPWGPPFDLGTVPTLLDRLGVEALAVGR